MMLCATGAGLFAPAVLGRALAQDKGKTMKVLFFTKSSGFQHSVITRGKSNELGLAERVLTEGAVMLSRGHETSVERRADGDAMIRS